MSDEVFESWLCRWGWHKWPRRSEKFYAESGMAFDIQWCQRKGCIIGEGCPMTDAKRDEIQSDYDEWRKTQHAVWSDGRSAWVAAEKLYTRRERERAARIASPESTTLCEANPCCIEERESIAAAIREEG